MIYFSLPLKEMNVINVKKLSEEEAKKILNKVIDLGDWSNEYQNCAFPQLFHKGVYIEIILLRCKRDQV